MMTSKNLTAMGVRHYVVVEPQEVEQYKKASAGLLVDVLPLDMSYKAKYKTCDEWGVTKSTGPGPARNFIWDHSVANGHAWHWIMDDNIWKFYRYNQNSKIPCTSPSFWTAMEDFVTRYKNVAMAGPQYESFITRKHKWPAFVANTRLYSCNLIRNDVPFRWRGRYNEDTILSLDMLKAGWCTIQFNVFLQKKMVTQKMSGGNTDELYKGIGKSPGEIYATGGTDEKSRMLVRVHPDVSKVVHRFSRTHHHVDYSGFKHRKLILHPDFVMPQGVNNYGMALVQKQTTKSAAP